MTTIQHRFDGGFAFREVSPPRPKGTILYLHGLGDSGLPLEPLMTEPRLAEWRQLAPDLSGYGKTPWSDPPRSLEEHARWVAAWALALAPERVVTIGHSMGGVIGLLLAEAYPNIARAFVNVEGNVSFEDCSFSRRAARYDMAAFVDEGYANLLDLVYRGGRRDPALRSYYASLRFCNPRAYYQNAVELVELSRGEELGERQSSLTMPNVYLLGDPRGTGEHSRSLLRAAGVKWRAVPDAGHWVFGDQHERFADEVVTFLGGVTESASDA